MTLEYWQKVREQANGPATAGAAQAEIDKYFFDNTEWKKRDAKVRRRLEKELREEE